MSLSQLAVEKNVGALTSDAMEKLCEHAKAQVDGATAEGVRRGEEEGPLPPPSPPPRLAAYTTDAPPLTPTHHQVLLERMNALARSKYDELENTLSSGRSFFDAAKSKEMGLEMASVDEMEASVCELEGVVQQLDDYVKGLERKVNKL